MDQIIITGANGLIGSSCCDVLKDSYDFVRFDISDANNPVDITDTDSVLKAVRSSAATHLVHLAAFTDVTAAWKQSGDTSGTAYKVNVLGTQNLVEACNSTGKHLINVSTAFVFDGEKGGKYTEEDLANPIEWYGETKALAEKYIQENADNWTIFRIDQPFKKEKFAKLDLAHKIGSDLEAKTLFPQFEDHYFGPTWIPDFVKVIDWSIRKNKSGVYHASSGESWTNLQFAQKIADILHSDTPVLGSKLADYLATNSRPYQKNTSLDCQKLISELDFELTTIEKALEQVEY